MSKQLPNCEETEELIIKKRERFEASVTNNANIWGFSSLGLQAKQAAMSMLSTKHGLYANIPIVCKADCCPYKTSCKLLDYGLAPIGEPCPTEVAQIEKRYLAYSEDFELDDANFTDNVIVNEIVQTDVMLERCKQLIQIEALPIQDVVVSISEDGTPITAPQVSKTIELNERLSRKRNELLSLMKATRKDKKEDAISSVSIADVLAEALAKEANKEFVIDVKPEHLE